MTKKDHRKFIKQVFKADGTGFGKVYHIHDR